MCSAVPAAPLSTFPAELVLCWEMLGCCGIWEMLGDVCWDAVGCWVLWDLGNAVGCLLGCCGLRELLGCCGMLGCCGIWEMLGALGKDPVPQGPAPAAPRALCS